MVFKLAYEVSCRSCAHPIFVALCADGFYRAFEQTEYPQADEGVWAWRKGLGMQEQSLRSGKRLHYCFGHHGYGSPDAALPQDTEKPGTPME